ncbi:mannose-6-phosphate isomerase, class I [Spongisporangium articulatum]|uniref:mannose-6-phosphate isomerase n=1 Tax=Spongisporangium articulatum TaxID=3362603 RepID=A0ABW8APF8_9ACTN
MNAPPAVAAMTNPVRDYDWGSRTALARLQGRKSTGGPEAELWMGAHPGSPSSVQVDGGDVSLPELIASAPEAVLGAATRAEFGDRLPFLLKILAIAKPLSVQVHPSTARAREVFGTAGSPYVDDAHKPELLHALEPTQALFGFRPAAEVAALLAPLGSRLSAVAAPLTTGGQSDAVLLHATLETLITWPKADRVELVAEVAAALDRLPDDVRTDPAHTWVAKLVDLYPLDPMVVAPLLLRLVDLAPGDAIFVPAGVPHCYLDGLGVEIMAASDNVLRCGLTPKPIAVQELLHVVDTSPGPYAQAVVSRDANGETSWLPPVPDFRLGRLDVDGSVALTPVPGPQVVLCTSGAVTVLAGGDAVQLLPGRSAFVTAGAGPVTVMGSGRIFRGAPGAL